jgi:hypothetical protein
MSADSAWDRAVALRDHWVREVEAALAEARVEALVMVSQAGNYPPWVKLEAWLPVAGAVARHRGELELIVDATPYREHPYVGTARASRGNEHIHIGPWPTHEFSDRHIREWTRYALGRAGKPSNYHPVADALIGMVTAMIPFVSGPHHNAVDHRFRNVLGLNGAKCLFFASFLLGIFGMQAGAAVGGGAGAAFFVVLAVAGFVGSAVMARTRTHRIAVPSQPTAPPRNLVLVDSWHTVISTLGGEVDAIKQEMAKAMAYADPGGISSGVEAYSYRTPYGYEERDRLMVIKNQSIVHVHVYRFADDLFVGWHAYLNYAQWGESTTVSRRVADGVITEFRELRPANYTPNQFDLIDLNSLSELVHRHIEQQVQRLMIERVIDQEIDFEIVRGDRTRSFDRAQQGAEARGGGLWGRIMRSAAAWQPRSETEIRKSTAPAATPAAPISIGVGGLGYLAGLLGWIATGFEFSIFLLVLVPISREFAVPLSAGVSGPGRAAWSAETRRAREHLAERR